MECAEGERGRGELPPLVRMDLGEVGGRMGVIEKEE